ncbi:THO complex subunit 5A-like [Zingiber officinale]|uniref:THO complex subunit 5B n=1 Tax=Zingiber officinale TaxID=94328 RepID=A0A8J5GSB9_ZINOF|nr:THO complex subunit 5A-like [Zingiber officinale]KAG6509070.1 hypothetical protein ZIOFF_034461 [Zingiber officinale]
MEAIEVARPTAHQLLEDTRVEMEAVASKMLFIKEEGSSKSELRELITQMSLHFITLRKVNRSILVEEDCIKAATEAAKGPVDTTTLQLHNLLYEKNHYLKAIKACKDFRSKYPDIELVPEEEFFSSAPEEIKGKAMADDVAHDLMLKRLNFELFQRKELCKLHEKLEQHKASLLDAISGRKKFLSSLPSHLKSLKKASLPVQQHLGISHTKKLKQLHAAEFLPPPLYIVYSQLLAQKEAFGEKIEMDILGSVKDAQTFALQQVNKENGSLSNLDNAKLEDDAPDDDEDVQRRRKRPKKNVVKDSVEQAGICQLHPLKIVLHVYDDEYTGAKPSRLITLKFEYLVKLNVVCVGFEDTDEKSDSNILCNLFPDDTGLDLPHQMSKLYSGDSLAFGEKGTSYPYKWAQHLAGIDFLPEVPPINVNGDHLNAGLINVSDFSSGLALYRRQNRVQTILQRIRSRKKAQMALVEQLDSLAKLKWPLLIYDNVPWASHTPVCTLQKWLPAGLIPDSSFSTSIAGQATNNVDLDMDRRSVTSWEVENAREDGELPTALPVATMPVDAPVSLSSEPLQLVDRSRSLALMSKNVTPVSMIKTRSFSKYEDELELVLDSDSEAEEQAYSNHLNENASSVVSNPWEDSAAKEFDFILGRNHGKDSVVKLNTKVKISIEYPLRPPIFSLSIDSGRSEWYNVLRAMEAELNLHILRVLPLNHENFILAHQIRCLAMLFDFHFDKHDAKRKSTSVMDVGLCTPISGMILTRSVRGRDRRKMISWNSIGCIPGYPS